MSADLLAEARALRDALRTGPAGVRHLRIRLGHLRTRLENIPAAVLIVDDAGQFIAVNSRASDLTGYTEKELLARSIQDLTTPAELEPVERLWRSFERMEHQSGRFRVLRKDGTELEAEYDAFRDVAPGVHVSFLRTVRDQRPDRSGH